MATFIKPKYNIIRSCNTIISLVRLVNKAYITEGGAMFFSFIYPFILLIFLGALKLSPSNVQNTNIAIILSGLLILTVYDAGLFSLNIRIQEWKESTLITQLGVLSIRKFEFLLGMGVFYLILMTIESVWLVSLAFMMQHIIGHIDVDKLDIKYILIPYAAGAFFSMCSGLLLAVLINNENTAVSIAVMITFPVGFLAGQLLPLNLIDQAPALKIVSQLFPQRYLTILMYHGWGWHSSTDSLLQINIKNILLATAYPLLIGIFTLIVATKLFKWQQK